MTTTEQSPTETTRRNWIAVMAVGLSTFTVVTAELLPVGLLPEIVDDLGVSSGVAGLTVVAPGLVAAITAVVLPVVATRVDRRLLLCGMLATLLAASLVSAVAPVFAVLLVARLIVGLCIGGIWTTVPGLAGRLVAERNAGLAASIMFSGVAVASVVGVPAGTFLGVAVGWRVSFVALAILAGVALVAVARLLPPLPPRDHLRFRSLFTLLGRAGVRSGVLVTLFLVTGHFTAYTYVSPFLIDVSGVAPGAVGSLLLVYGVAGVCGTFVGGTVAHRTRTMIAVVAATITATVLVLPTIEGAVWLSAALLAVWGLAYGAAPVGLQTWAVRETEDMPDAAGPMLSGVFNLGISLGALLGGRVIDAHGASSVMWCAGALCALALGVTLLSPARRWADADTKNAPTYRVEAFSLVAPTGFEPALPP